MRSGALRQLPPLRAMASEVLARVHACSRVSEAEAFDLGSRAQVSDCWSQWEWSALVQRWNALLQIRVAVRIWRRRRRGGAALSQQMLGSGHGGRESLPLRVQHSESFASRSAARWAGGLCDNLLWSRVNLPSLASLRSDPLSFGSDRTRRSRKRRFDEHLVHFTAYLPGHAMRLMANNISNARAPLQSMRAIYGRPTGAPEWS